LRRKTAGFTRVGSASAKQHPPLLVAVKANHQTEISFYESKKDALNINQTF